MQQKLKNYQDNYYAGTNQYGTKEEVDEWLGKY